MQLTISRDGHERCLEQVRPNVSDGRTAKETTPARSGMGAHEPSDGLKAASPVPLSAVAAVAHKTPFEKYSERALPSPESTGTGPS